MFGVPGQDFHQESANDPTVKTFRATRFNIDFPPAALSHMRGTGAVPFHAPVAAQRNWQPAWNRNKVPIGRDGRIAGTFGSEDEPDGPSVSRAVDRALARLV